MKVNAEAVDITYKKTGQPTTNNADNAVEGRLKVTHEMDLEFDWGADLTVDFGPIEIPVGGGGSGGVSISTVTVTVDRAFGYKCIADNDNSIDPWAELSVLAGNPIPGVVVSDRTQFGLQTATRLHEAGMRVRTTAGPVLDASATASLGNSGADLK